MCGSYSYKTVHSKNGYMPHGNYVCIANIMNLQYLKLYYLKLQLLIIREQSGSLEYRVKSLVEEVNTLRLALTERENIISKLRIDIQSSSESVQKVSKYVWLFY